MDDLKISHLPLVTKDGLYAGLLSEDALYESEDDTQPAQSTLRQGFFPHVREGAHFFEVMEVCTQHRITYYARSANASTNCASTGASTPTAEHCTKCTGTSSACHHVTDG